MEENC